MFWGLDAMITNSYLIYSDFKDVLAMTHTEFRLQCAWLILAFEPRQSAANQQIACKGRYAYFPTSWKTT